MGHSKAKRLKTLRKYFTSLRSKKVLLKFLRYCGCFNVFVHPVNNLVQLQKLASKSPTCLIRCLLSRIKNLRKVRARMKFLSSGCTSSLPRLRRIKLQDSNLVILTFNSANKHAHQGHRFWSLFFCWFCAFAIRLSLFAFMYSTISCLPDSGCTIQNSNCSYISCFI